MLSASRLESGEAEINCHVLALVDALESVIGSIVCKGRRQLAREHVEDTLLRAALDHAMTQPGASGITRTEAIRSSARRAIRVCVRIDQVAVSDLISLVHVHVSFDAEVSQTSVQHMMRILESRH